MKRFLFVIALMLTAASVSAQQRNVEFRTGDAFSGPVQSVRMERAFFSKLDGTTYEGPRCLVAVASYSPDGKRSEQQTLKDDGARGDRYVHLYDDSGNQLEQSNYDGQNNLLSRFVYWRETGETLTYNGDGTLRQRVQPVWNEKRELVEVRTYDGNGGLLKREVYARDADKSVWKTYRADSSLEREVVYSLNYGGPHHSEERDYNPDGSISGRRVSDVDATVNNLEAVVEKKNGMPPQKTRETREYDSRRNLIKMTHYKWNTETGEFEPFAVDYNEITYYR
jgi:antitoxin component YwqK of YwqJK toxin-antitoxin module